MSTIRTILRTLIYQYLILFIGVSIGFIINAEWIGYKSNLVNKSINNIFFRREFDVNMCDSIKKFGSFRLWCFNGYPDGYEVIEDGLLAEEFYIAKFRFVNNEGKQVEKIESTRIRWKPWEYYWDNPEPWTEEDIDSYLKNGTLNSKESDKALKLYDELRNMNTN